MKRFIRNFLVVCLILPVTITITACFRLGPRGGMEITLICYRFEKISIGEESLFIINQNIDVTDIESFIEKVCPETPFDIVENMSELIFNQCLKYFDMELFPTGVYKDNFPYKLIFNSTEEIDDYKITVEYIFEAVVATLCWD